MASDGDTNLAAGWAIFGSLSLNGIGDISVVREHGRSFVTVTARCTAEEVRILSDLQDSDEPIFVAWCSGGGAEPEHMSVEIVRIAREVIRDGIASDRVVRIELRETAEARPRAPEGGVLIHVTYRPEAHESQRFEATRHWPTSSRTFAAATPIEALYWFYKAYHEECGGPDPRAALLKMTAGTGLMDSVISRLSEKAGEVKP